MVSINLCTDQLVVALADPAQIAGLSRWSRDEEMSFVASEAERFPRLKGVAEEVLALKADLVLAGTFSGTATRAFLRQKGVRVEDFSPPRTLDEAKAEVTRAGDLLGQPQRARALLGRIDAALAALMPAAYSRTAARPLTALALMRRGYAVGPDTLLAQAMTRAGLVNAAERLGIGSIDKASLETVMKAKPDVLVVENLGRFARDQGTALIGHSALARLVPPERRIGLAVNELSCAGPALPGMLRRIASEVARLRARAAGAR